MEMVKNWKDILTSKQRKQLIKEATKALEGLVSSSEANDVLKDVRISKKGGKHHHYQELYLTAKGLEEKQCCAGHDRAEVDDSRSTEYCKSYNKERKIPKKEFRNVVKDYQLTSTVISEIAARLTG